MMELWSPQLKKENLLMMPNHQVLAVITIQEQLTDFFYIPVDRRRAAPHDNFLFKSRLLQQGYRYIIGTFVRSFSL